MRRLALTVSLLATIANACASGDATDENDENDLDIAPDAAEVADTAEDPTPDEDAPTDDATPDGDITPDDTAPGDPNPGDPTPDLGRPDMTGIPVDCEVRGDECEPSAIYCDPDQSAIIFCSRCGEILRTEACGEAEVCELIAGAGRCRACEGEECPDIDACEPGTRTCLDWNTSQICGDDGTIDTVADCPGGRRCFEGSCGSPGGVTATTCGVNIDPVRGCNGHLCVCGEEWLEAGDADGICASTFPRGYCTTSGCVANRCDTDAEVCADFGISGMMAGADVCVTREDCSIVGRPCGSGAASLTCVELPGRRGTGSPVEWELACWLPGLSTIGDTCAGDQDCLGGVCRTGTGVLADVRYCTAQCGADGGCPSHASCVEDPDGELPYVCLADGNNIDCPRMDTEPLNIAPTPPLRRYGAGSTSVCYFAR